MNIETTWRYRLFLLCLATAMALPGCGTNPVTGKRELHLLSEEAEIQIGAENYVPAQQSQGGPYNTNPELTAYVSGIGSKLAKVSDRSELPYEFSVINNSVPNAWALPGGKIAINRGLLLELNSEAELAAVLGHEIVHAAARHGAKGVERGILSQIGVAAVGVAAQDEPLANFIVGGATVATQLVNTKYGRDAELEADRYGMEYMAKAGFDPQAAVSLQQTFVELSKDRKANWLEGLFASHPPSQERVKANQALAAKLPKGLELGTEEYQRRLAELRKAKPAYDKFEEGQHALAEKAYDRAIGLADQAIAIEPREAHFYGLRGDAQLLQQRLPQAVADYDRAIERNARYFHYHLHRGLAKQQLGDESGARRDLQTSLQLLPTANAHHALGELALASGNEAEAVEHFRVAASADSALGRKAALALVRLDLPRQPERYLPVRHGIDRAGRLVVEIVNRTPVPVRDIVLALEDSATGRTLQRLPLDLTIPPGKSVTAATGIRLNEAGLSRQLRVRVVAATPVQ